MKVGTFAWNHHRHLEAYFAVPCAGAVLHMINIRLAPEHIAYVINHAEDEILLIDDNLVPLIAPIVSQLKTVKHFIIMGDAVAVESMPIPNALPMKRYLQRQMNSSHSQKI